MSERESWSWELGLIFAALGSAVGLGNIWMFPMLVGENGGAAFLIPYILTIALLAWVGLTIEFNTGRIAQAGPSKAYERLGVPGGKYLGALAVLRVSLVLAWYSSVVGWTIRYIIAPFSSGFWEDPQTYFSTVSSAGQSALFAVIAIVATGLIVMGGVRKGIEPIVKGMMITLFALLIVVVLRAVTLPNALKGLEYYLIPDISKLSPRVVLNAMAQAFFSCSLAGAAMVVYGSYLKKDSDSVVSAITTAFGDTTVAILAGFAVFPLVLAFGISPSAGAGLLFVSLPHAFAEMPGGTLIALIFFIAAAFAGITSTVSMLEVSTEALLQYTKLDRKKVSVILMVLLSLLAVPIAFYPVIWNYARYIVLYTGPIVAILPPIALFWVRNPEETLEDINRGAIKKLGRWFIYWGKYIYPVGILAAYLLNIVG
ncbi:sodium-dependent transporter [Thermococcus aggregans]|uniref:Sodium-dependent transporter n=1 Tax=Thermococcus aggregans TaxID=110163 RepID=A0A9E7MWB1_THEAG|nr:sodium-dependent transporter [Thermococcus aggregans]USS40080.1 sodium-dependent transporter [Thermococcus aggregans]